MITLFRQCSLADLDVLREFSRQRYLETFAHLNTPENMAAYLDEAFAEERMRTELSNPDSSFHFLYWDDRLAGYIKLTRQGHRQMFMTSSPWSLSESISRRIFRDMVWEDS